MKGLPGYRYDVFLSYSRAQHWPTFVEHHLLPMLRHWLGEELGTDARIFRDVESIQVGRHWPREIAEALAQSRVIVALLSRTYFQREWCRRELGGMLCRARWLQEQGLSDHIIFPVAIHDCDPADLPEIVQSLQILNIHPYADPFMHPQSMRREQLSVALQPLCAEIARRLEQLPDDILAWPADDTTYRDRLVPVPRPRPSIPLLGAAS